MLRKVWAMKKAVQDDTEGMTTLECLRYINKHAPRLGLKKAKRADRPVSRPGQK